MANASQPVEKRPRGIFFYLAMIVLVALVTLILTALLMNIFQRQQEAKQYYFEKVKLDENTIDPEIWKENFPHQYDGYSRTVDKVRTKHGGSDAFSKLETHPFLVKFYKGYLFSVDFREERGHAFMLKDQDETLRVKQGKQPGACLHCHSSVIPAYREAGNGDVMKGFEKVCGMDYPEARKLVSHPVSCIDCHDPKTLYLRVTRPAFQVGIKAFANSVATAYQEHLKKENGKPEKEKFTFPPYPSIERWVKDKSKSEYEVNTLANRQEMRTFVCAQCHVEYYFKGQGKVLTYPWHKGIKVEQIEEYYDSQKFVDWKHEYTGAELLKAQHPEFEMWSQGIHARSGVSCADCHMPYKREGAIKISDHHIRSPLLNINRACQTCHHFPEEELKARAEAIQDKTALLIGRAEEAMGKLIDELREVKGMNPDALNKAKALQRKAQWRLDFVLSENSMGFHAPQETARILGEAIDYAHQGRIAILQGLTKK